MSQPTALIIDDEPDILELLSITLMRMGIDCDTAQNVMTGKEKISEHSYDLCLTDMKLPDGNGLELVEHIQNEQPNTPVAVITAHGSMQTAVEAMKLGAFDFISKPVDLGNLRTIVTNALQVKPSEKSSSSVKGSEHEFIGETDVMLRLKSLIQRVSKSQAPIYIKGESGTGKELVAKLIHQNGPRATEPFIAINCGAIPADLMESELFGHKKGSFTGANVDKEGIFQAANGGTLFLDEIADLPLSMQVKLLRAIQERAIRPVGAEKEVSVNVRVLSASHKDLNALVQSGDFRQDLFYRINVIEVDVPALRSRKDDIPQLVQYFAQKLAKRNDIPLPKFSESAIQKLMSYSYPGNIRELENIIERAVTLSFNETIEDSDIQLTPIAPEETTDTTSYRESIPLDDYLESIEKSEIEKALEQTNGNKTAAAELLGISFRAIRYKCKKLGID